MANLIAPQQAIPANVEASPLKQASILPADIKTAGKNGKEILKDAKSASEAFNASLKEELENNAKKETLKKVVPQTAGHPAITPQIATPPVAVQAQLQEMVNSKTAAVDPKQTKGENKKGLVGNTEINAKTLSALGLGVNVNQGAQQQANGLNALIGSKAEKTVSNANDLSEKLKSVKANNLNPLQEVMLTEQVAAKKAALDPQTAAPQGAVVNAELLQALQSVTGKNPEFGHSFDVESLDAGMGAGIAKELSLNGKEESTQKRTPVSKVSTSDFLDLRNLSQKNITPIGQSATGSSLDLGTQLKNKDGKKDKLESLTGREAFAGAFASRIDNNSHVKTIDAPVTQGTAGKNVLSHDAIHQMTQSVNMLSQARQDGEIKIRLRPDHLGELHMSVKTQGQQVSLEIKAQNNESRKIIEESLASLKDSLGQQNLTLARVDIVNAPAHAQNAADQGMQMDMSQFRQNSGQSSERGFDQGNGRQDLHYEEMSAPVNLNAARLSGVNARAGQGLDLIA